jgi:uncharacterized membrane protein YadS
MNTRNDKIDWSSLWRSEDWWACWIGWFILVLAIAGMLPHPPKIATWVSLAAAFPKGWSTLGTSIVFFITTCVLTLIGAAFMKRELKLYVPGFLIIFILAFLAMFIGSQKFIKAWGIEYVIWALAFGLIISNIFSVPKVLKAAGLTEFFVKIGLVCMGATIMFSVVVATAVWFMTYWICRKFKVSERFSAIIATANSICGVSATIAAGGAIQGDPKEVSYMIAWVMVCAVVLILVMPPLAIWMNLPNNMAGAWIGGVIDKGKAAVQAAAMVKMAQNVLIGVVAFLMALWATMILERKEHPDAERPSYMEIWYRFPKFVIGFMVASLIVSFIVEPAMGEKAAKAIAGACKNYRSWFFALCFVSIGLETNFKELVSVGGGRPAIAYWLSQTANAIWTLFIAWILWSGTFFTPAILPD